MEKFQIAEISAIETHPLRSLVLRNRDASIPCPFEGDTDTTTTHFACFCEDKIITIASFYLRKNELFGTKPMMQLRGMATHPNFIGRGYGKALILFANDYYSRQGVALIWCNARKTAFDFYAKLGFIPVGENFIIPEIGVHRVLYFNLE